jgi:hypothetical protein
MNDKICDLILRDPWRMRVLKIARDLDLPDWWVGAGFVRNLVWDYLHGFAEMTRLSDVDLIYFDPKQTSTDRETHLELLLRKQAADIPWSVKNQSRMHFVNAHNPYLSSADAVSYWPEVATCVAVKLDPTGLPQILAPHGLEDLFNLVVRPTSNSAACQEKYLARIEDKRWHERWPQLTIY